MDKKYVARQLALVVRNIQKGFREPVGISIKMDGEFDINSDIIDMDEYYICLENYGYEFTFLKSVTHFKGREITWSLNIYLTDIIKNIPDKRVREYLCSMNQKNSQ